MPSDQQPPKGSAVALRGPSDWRRTWHFALATTLAALLALAVAIALEISHPWWAAMTVWLVAQPTRGLLLERSFARLAGSGIGALVGYGVLVAFPSHPLWLLTALTAWIGLCCGAGAMFHHFRNYGFVLAGWTAAIVALFGLTDPGHEAAIAVGRVGSTTLGVLAVTLMTVTLIPANSGDLIAGRLRDLVVRAVAWLAGGAASHHEQQKNDEDRRLLAEIGALESALDGGVAGSRRGRSIASTQRASLEALINLLAIGYAPSGTTRFDAANRLDRHCMAEAAADAQAAATPEILSRRLSTFACAFIDMPTLAASVATLARALGGTATVDRLPRTWEWHDAGMASVRAMLTVMLASIVWWVTGWTEAPMLVMTAALFACLFSSHDHATAAVNDVLKGTVCGALLGFACRLCLWPWMTTPALQLFSITPFLMWGAYLMSRPGASKMAIDLNMTFLLITRPGSHETVAPFDVAMQAIAITGGVLIALAGYHFIPASRSAKLAAAARRMARRLELVAKCPDRIVIDDLRPLTSDVLRMAVLGEPADRLGVALQEQALVALGEASALADASAGRYSCRDRKLIARRLVGYAAALREAARVLSSPARPRRNA